MAGESAFVTGDGTNLEELLDLAVNTEEAEENEQTRQVWIQLCGMPDHLTYEKGKVWAREEQARKDALDRTWHDKLIEMERLIETRCRGRMLAAGFSEDELQGQYVPCLPPFVDQSDPRMPAFKEAMRLLKRDEQAKFRAIGCVTSSDEPTPANATNAKQPGAASPVNVESPGTKQPGQKSSKKRGRKMNSDPTADEQLCESWKKSGYKTYAEFCTKEGHSETKVKAAVDRHRHRLAKRRKK